MKLTSFLLIFFLNSVYSSNVYTVSVVKGASTSITCFNSAISYVQNAVVKVKFNDQTFAEILYDKTEFRFYKPPTSRADRIIVSQTGSLELDHITLADEGRFSCTSSGLGFDEEIIETDLQVYIQPEVETSVSSNVVAKQSGDDHRLVEAARCIALNGKPEATITWKTDRNLVFSHNSSITNSDDFSTTSSKLFISPSKYYNNQQFICSVSHFAFKEPLETSITINVLYPPDVPSISPNKDQTQLTCTSDANPPPTIMWSLPNGNDVISDVIDINAQGAGRLNDSYKCLATNEQGSEMLVMTLGEILTPQPVMQSSMTGTIVGVVIGVLLLLGVIIVLVYIFILKPSRSKDPGPYLPQTARDSRRPMIEHMSAREPPPSPKHPPPSFANSGSETSSDDEGNHDVDIEVNPYTTIDAAKPTTDDDDVIKGTITSRASLNFQARRQRPGNSPYHQSSRTPSRLSQHKPFNYMQPPAPAARGYEGNYSEIDHTNYRPGNHGATVRRNEEPVEYAQIRKHQPDTHVV